MTFERIMQAFLAKKDLTYNDLVGLVEYHGSHKKKIADECLLNQWKAFHQEFKLIVKVMKADMPYVQTLLDSYKAKLLGEEATPNETITSS
jgi:hypothetical protein